MDSLPSERWRVRVHGVLGWLMGSDNGSSGFYRMLQSSDYAHGSTRLVRPFTSTGKEEERRVSTLPLVLVQTSPFKG
ncbi:hypothetical protein KSD_48100 [Ktedonobacter sp. SOSP1-85]|uniref:hypothetical protein n=1 Tax=Ktedonobacter sp. SOSP1-85 TaxID=2778367 RepID=UPI001915CB62|nr:hypothetical protein [Ktedonobacter sp. SOSP1-85]GHO77039.1 hypothetical protein KSD_48100 [Ktedonobacter sp. SOSP1-85]